MQIYVVTAGHYSDYGIVKVFTDKELAETYLDRYIKVHGNMSGPRIEEFEAGASSDPELIALFDKRKLHNYFVHVIADQTDVYIEEYDSGYSRNKVKKHVSGKTIYYVVYVTARDTDHAAKIGQDLVAQYKAEEEGIA